MADAVSKLYAEIGFKVNQDGLKQVQSILKDFAKQMQSINKATKEAAKQYGIFSKDQAKQAMADEKLATQKAKTEEVRTRQSLKIKNQEFKEEMAIRKAKFDEKIKQEREDERIARNEQRRNEKSARERRKVLQDALSTTGSFVRSIGNYLKVGATGISRLLYSGVQESLGRSISTRDFMMMTGANIGDIQSVVSRFASIGESVDQNTIMGDLIKLSQNIASIALGQGNVSAYKLLGTSVRRGDISGMIRGIGMAGQGMDPDFFAKLIGDVGLPSYWLSFFRAKGGGQEITNFIDQEGQEKIVQAKESLGTLRVAIKNFSDWLTATLSPTIIELSSGLQIWVQDMSVALKGETGKRLSENLKELANRIVDFVKRFDTEKIVSLVSSFVGALEYLAGKVVWLAKKFGYVPESEKEQYMKDFSAKIRGRMMSGDMQDWVINKEAQRIGYRPSGTTGYYDNRIINSTVNVKDEDVVDAVRNEAIKFGGLSIDPRSLAAISGFGGDTSGK